MMSACIIAIGDELLNGFTLDTNTQWLKEELSKSNVNVTKSIIIPDDEIFISHELKKTLDEDYDFIIFSGGLGPTHDDITKKTLSNFFRLPLVSDQEYLKNLRKRFKNHIKDSKKTTKVKELNKLDSMIESQSLILDSFNPMENKLGTALGMIGKFNNSQIIVLPGVPKELKQMFKDNIMSDFIPLKSSIPMITLKTTGITESKLYILLENFIFKNKQKLKFSFLPHFTGVNIRISTLDDSSLNDVIIQEVKEKIGTYYYGKNNESLNSIVSSLLIKKKITISIAESCTGGLLSKKLTDFSGSSKYLIGSIVAYSNNVKNEILKVPDDILINKGAVSAETALIMSDNVMKLFNTDMGISITGISGPSGESSEKPLGLYYISIKYGDDHFFKKFIFNINEREVHREVASNTALNLIRLALDIQE